MHFYLLWLEDLNLAYDDKTLPKQPSSLATNCKAEALGLALKKQNTVPKCTSSHKIRFTDSKLTQVSQRNDWSTEGLDNSGYCVASSEDNQFQIADELCGVYIF